MWIEENAHRLLAVHTRVHTYRVLGGSGQFVNLPILGPAITFRFEAGTDKERAAIVPWAAVTSVEMEAQ